VTSVRRRGDYEILEQLQGCSYKWLLIHCGCVRFSRACYRGSARQPCDDAVHTSVHTRSSTWASIFPHSLHSARDDAPPRTTCISMSSLPRLSHTSAATR